MNAILTYLHHVRDELGHVVWPTPRQAVAHTLMIILVSIAVAILVAGVDYLLTTAVSSVVGG